MDTSLAATVRTTGKKGVVRKLRAAGGLPAVVYGPDAPPVHVTVDATALSTIFRKTGDANTVIELKIDGTTVPTLVRSSQRHPVSRELVHVDFYRVSKKRKVEVMVPVVGTGKPAGAILGGRMRVIRRSIKARCPYDAIPSQLEIDVSSMHIGDMVLASQIALPDGVELVFDHDFNVLTVYGKKAARPTDLDGEPADGAEAPAAAE